MGGTATTLIVIYSMTRYTVAPHTPDEALRRRALVPKRRELIFKYSYASDLITKYILDKNLSTNLGLFPSLKNAIALIVFSITISLSQKIRNVFTW